MENSVENVDGAAADLSEPLGVVLPPDREFVVSGSKMSPQTRTVLAPTAESAVIQTIAALVATGHPADIRTSGLDEAYGFFWSHGGCDTAVQAVAVGSEAHRSERFWGRTPEPPVVRAQLTGTGSWQ